ncbi:putative aldouronate transport system permease protein [Paenibacillus sp. UNCCL117]|uniref:carbohydrate ABC transporter permease n=1 Tax=unclassified Paenibacillus TaxID=185978 RepID=UPI0008914B11|nr:MULTISPECIES: carbohydrate ABC transporter permease [unclassified Paenibacillus]SDD02797.1 putative aldouronate transport system permease protein [Paenibacillus sp. cl123]SFW32419.1 putative aldouronate transport system permease protein [Paenibacillus sp. UNCCL117]
MRAKENVYQWLINLFMALLACLCVLPFVLLFSASFTSQEAIIRNGFTFIPSEFSTEAYTYLWNDAAKLARAYGVTITVTAIGTAVSLAITTLLAYPLSRKDLPLRNFFAFFIFFTMLFNGGLVPLYLIYTKLFELKNTIWSLIIPIGLTNAFFVMITRTFFQTTIPNEVIESGKIDGAGELRIFGQIVLPLSLPILATVGLFQTIHYWNDWFNGLIFLTDSRLFSIQNLLNRILLDAQYLSTMDFGSAQGELTSSIPTQSIRFAIAVIGIVPILLIYPFFQGFFVKGLTVGAVKG